MPGQRSCLLVNAFYQVSIFDSLKKRVSRLLKTRSADTYLGVLFLNEIREYLYLDAPLTITTVHASQTTNVAMSNIMGNKQNTPDNDPDLENVPYKELTERNVYANLLLEAIKEDPEGLGNNAALDWPAYYRVCYEDLLSMKNQGVEVSSKLEKLFQAIEKEPVELKNKILSGFAASENEKAFLNGKIKDVLRKIGQISPILSARLRLSNKSAFLFSRAFLLEGDKFEKNSLLDYSKMLDEEFIAKIAEIWLLKGKNMPREWVLK
jgi:hypothetical protein